MGDAMTAIANVTVTATATMTMSVVIETLDIVALAIVGVTGDQQPRCLYHRNTFAFVSIVVTPRLIVLYLLTTVFAVLKHVFVNVRVVAMHLLLYCFTKQSLWPEQPMLAYITS